MCCSFSNVCTYIYFLRLCCQLWLKRETASRNTEYRKKKQLVYVCLQSYHGDQSRWVSDDYTLTQADHLKISLWIVSRFDIIRFQKQEKTRTPNKRKETIGIGNDYKNFHKYFSNEYISDSMLPEISVIQVQLTTTVNRDFTEEVQLKLLMLFEGLSIEIYHVTEGHCCNEHSKFRGRNNKTKTTLNLPYFKRAAKKAH